MVDFFLSFCLKKFCLSNLLKMSLGDVKTDAGIKKLNGFLADKSYIEG